jgi:hypothetical protein
MPHQTAENLTQAAQAASFQVSSLRDALKGCNAVQGLAILALIERAANLQRDIDALRAAVLADCDSSPQTQAARGATAKPSRADWLAQLSVDERRAAGV